MVVVDTNALIWWIEESELLSARAKKELDKQAKKESSIIVSTVSILEIATLIDKGRLTLNIDLEKWVERLECLPFMEVEPLDSYTAIHSRKLPDDFHKDPADRMIVALARKHGIPLVTSDGKIQKYPHVQTIW